MRFGVQVPPFGPFAEPDALASLAADAETAGWDGFFVWDHVVFDQSFHPVADPWIGLAAVATRTTSLRLGTMVTPLARRRPWQVARATVSLDRLSHGRLTLGVGLGDPTAMDFVAFGEEADARVRAARLDESLDVLAGLWSGEPFSYVGEHMTVEEVVFLPRAVQEPRIPVWVGGWWPNKRPMRRAARWDGVIASRWGAQITPEQVQELRTYVAAHRTRPEAFDVVVLGASPGDEPRRAAEQVQAHAEVGATWWVEDVSPWRFGADWESQWQDVDTDRMRERVQQGPPAF